MPPGKPTSLRLSPRDHEMLADLKDWLGLETTTVFRLALRRLHQLEERSRREKIRKKSGEGA